MIMDGADMVDPAQLIGEVHAYIDLHDEYICGHDEYDHAERLKEQATKLLDQVSTWQPPITR